MPTGEPQYTADFMRSIGVDLQGVAIQSVAVPVAYRNLGVRQPRLSTPKSTRPALKLTRPFDATSPTLFKIYSSGELVPKVVITIRPEAGQRFVMTLSDVEVVDISRQSDGTDAIELSCANIESNWPDAPTGHQRRRAFYLDSRGRR